MKLKINKKNFDFIKKGIKDFELRDAHITFICEETGRTTKKKVLSAEVISKSEYPRTIRANKDCFDDKDTEVIVFNLE